MENRIFVYESGAERYIQAKDQVNATIERFAFPLLALGNLENKSYHRVLEKRYKGRFSTIYLTCCDDYYYFVVEVLPSEHSRFILSNLKVSDAFTVDGMQFFAVAHEGDPKIQLQRLEQLIKRFEDRFFDFHAEAVKAVRNIVESSAFRGRRDGINIVSLDYALQASDVALAKANHDLKRIQRYQQSEMETLTRELSSARAERVAIEARLKLVLEDNVKMRGSIRYKEIKRKRELQELDKRQGLLYAELSRLEETQRSVSVMQHSEAAVQIGETNASRSVSSQSQLGKLFKVQDQGTQSGDLQPCDLVFNAMAGKGEISLNYRWLDGSRTSALENTTTGGSDYAKLSCCSQSSYFIKASQERVDLRQNTLVYSIRSLAKQQLRLKEFFFGPSVATVTVTRAPELTYLGLPADSKLSNLEITDSGLIYLYICGYYDSGEVLYNLRALNLSFTEIVALPLENMPNLTDLDVSWTSIEALDLTAVPKLARFSCGSSRLTLLNVAANVELERISAAYTRITYLQIDRNLRLAELVIDSTLIYQIDVASNPQLVFFSARNTNIAVLDFSSNSQLRRIEVAGSKLEELHFSEENSITSIDASFTRLRSLDALKVTAQLTDFCASCTAIGGKADLRANAWLQRLDLSRTMLTEIVLAGLSKLSHLDVSFAPIYRVDVRALDALETLLCQPECRVCVEGDSRFFEQNKDARGWYWERCTAGRGIAVD